MGYSKHCIYDHTEYSKNIDIGKTNMRLHRFYINEMHNRFGPISMGEVVWIHDEKLINQWLRVLRYHVGDELVLFNDQEERLYKIIVIDKTTSIKLEMLTELKRKIPTKQVYLLWSLLKKDKNDWVIQKATEIGVHKLVPLLADRSEKTGFNIDRAHKIAIEAAEQCGRGDIPEVREPITTLEAVQEYGNIELLICEQHENSEKLETKLLDKVGLPVGPEGGWSDTEKELFKNSHVSHIGLGDFTLRAETASVVALARLFSG